MKPKTLLDTLPPTCVVKDLPLDCIEIGEQLVRADPNDDALIELAADIQQHGLLQPIGVRAAGADTYQLLWGSRRLAAARRLRWTHVPAHVYTTTDEATKILALVENLHRSQMTLNEECDAVSHLHHVGSLSPDQIAARLSRGRQWVLARLAIPSLPLEVREPLLSGRLQLGSAEAIALIDDEGARRYLVETARASDLSVAQVRDLCAAYKASPTTSDAIAAGLHTAATIDQLPTPHLPCAACGTLRPLHQTTLIRVCSSGCRTDATRQDS